MKIGELETDPADFNEFLEKEHEIFQEGEY